MNWRFREAVVSPPTRGQAATRQEYAELIDSDGNVVFSINKPVSGVVTSEIDGAAPFIPPSVPEVPATPDAQDAVDALVTLGLVTQAEA